MRRLLLIRHSKSSWKHPHLIDHDRPLSKRGEQDAPIMAQRLLSSSEQLDTIITSTAVRAMGIARAIAETLNVRLVDNPNLYTFSYLDLLEEIHNLKENWYRVAVVGHNPAITECVNLLGDENIANVPTSGIVSLDCDISSWQTLSTNTCRIVHFDYPKKLIHRQE